MRKFATLVALSLIISFLVYCSSVKAEEDVWTSPYSGRKVPVGRLSRFGGLDVGDVIKTLRTEGVQFAFLPESLDVRLIDPRNTDFSKKI